MCGKSRWIVHEAWTGYHLTVLAIEKPDHLECTFCWIQQSRKNKFSEFYQSLAKETEDHPEFLIRNYLPSKQVLPMENIEPLEQLTKKLSTCLY